MSQDFFADAIAELRREIEELRKQDEIHWKTRRTLIAERDDARARYARAVGYGPHAHAGVWISDEDAKRISEDGP